jgi:hypothetical protein
VKNSAILQRWCNTTGTNRNNNRGLPQNRGESRISRVRGGKRGMKGWCHRCCRTGNRPYCTSKPLVLLLLLLQPKAASSTPLSVLCRHAVMCVWLQAWGATTGATGTEASAADAAAAAAPAPAKSSARGAVLRSAPSPPLPPPPRLRSACKVDTIISCCYLGHCCTHLPMRLLQGSAHPQQAGRQAGRLTLLPLVRHVTVDSRLGACWFGRGGAAARPGQAVRGPPLGGWAWSS